MKKFFAVVLLLGFAFSGAAFSEEVYAAKGMVSSAHELASQAGVEIMKKGGNAIDAAVATALALNVVEFNASGIGGGGFTTIRFAKTGEIVCLDYREMGPGAAKKDMFASEQSKTEKWTQDGGKSIGVPGWLMGMFHLLEHYGTKSFAEVAAPAIRYAEEGFAIHPMQKGIITDEFERLIKWNNPETLPFLKDMLPLEAGQLLKQPNLAKTFRLIGEKGKEVFYGGEIGEAIVKTVQKAGGIITIDDLKNYKLEVRKPMSGTYRGYTIYSPPPASSGGTHIVQVMNMLENFDIKKMGREKSETLHVLAESLKIMYADRAKFMADTAFAPVPLTGLTSKEYAKASIARIDMKKAALEIAPGDPLAFDKKTSSVPYTGGLGSEKISTSSFAVVDSEGNIVSSTNTINFFMGSAVYVPEYGFLLNDEMDDFSTNPESVNAPEPGKRMLSSMSPTIVLDPQGQPFMAVGTAGATRILSAISQIIMNVVDHGMKMDAAIDSPRIGNLVSGGKTQPLMFEKGNDISLLPELNSLGHKCEERDFGGWFGTAQGIMFDRSGSEVKLNGGADARRLGVPVGF